MSAAPNETAAPAKNTRTLVGRVVSDKRAKTVTVLVERRAAHPLYGKIVKRYTTVHAHDEKEEAGEGDLVYVMETRPLSKTKRFRLTEIWRKAGVR